MNKMRRRFVWILVVLVLSLGVWAAGQGAPSPGAVRLLVVDETKTFLSTMRVGALVGALRGFGLFEVDVRLADVTSSWDDPLSDAAMGVDSEPYDIILIIPIGLDDGAVDWVWIVSDGPTCLSAAVLGGAQLIEQIVGAVFEGVVRPVGVYDDLMPSFLFAEYVLEGWIR